MEFTPAERELTYTLLIELLSYQFCYPVRWIETQDVILGAKRVERLVEIGPGSTLVNMAKRTLDSKYHEADVISGIQRRLLTHKLHFKEIYYEDEQQAEESSTNIDAPDNVPINLAPTVAAVPNSPAPQTTRALTADTPVTVAEIVKMIVASTLKKPVTEVSMENTIKGYAAGRSTLQNEIIGYLDKELGSLPPDAEEMKLSDMCAFLQPTFTGQLGQQSSSMVNRMVSSKMPGSFTVRSIRKDLERRFGLATGRQDSVLVLATGMQPAARFTSDADAHGFVDDVARRYMTSAGIELAPLADTSGSGAAVAIDPAVLDKLREDQDALNRRVMGAYSSHFQSEAKTSKESELQDTVNMLQQQLGSWLGEHGETYGDGITALFDANKARSYDSSWNWGMQAVIRSYFAILDGTVDQSERLAGKLALQIRNQCTPRVLETMRHLKKMAEKTRVRQPNAQRYVVAAQFLGDMIRICVNDLNSAPVVRGVMQTMAPRTRVSAQGKIEYFEVSRSVEKSIDVVDSTVKALPSPPLEEDFKECVVITAVAPHSHLRIKRKSKSGWVDNEELTMDYWDALTSGASHGDTFIDKTVLITGASKGSIGLSLLKGVLSGGAQVIITSRSLSAVTAKFYQELYVQYGARGSRLVVVPFNQGSKQDIESLVAYIYDTLGWDLDYIVPFAAVPENGRDISNIDSHSELAHRVMLTNTVRLLGEVKTYKSRRGVITRPAHCILPLSPNHGIFGGDGLYAEGKLGLEALLNKRRSEGWSDYLSVCGAVIGWVRGTGLMAVNDIVAEGIEQLGVRTFSQEEMASNILGLMSPTMTSVCQSEAIIADLAGGMDAVDDFDEAVTEIRRKLNLEAEICRAVLLEEELDAKAANPNLHKLLGDLRPTQIQPRMNISLGFPRALDYDTEIAPLHEQLSGMVDLERVVVVAGFAEVGPCGNSRTRWEMEAYGELSASGCIEMAWIMGFIKHHQGPLAGKEYYDGWVDTTTKQPVADQDVKAQYEARILAHTGIRLIERNSEGSDKPTHKPYLHELVISEDLQPFEASRETAGHFKQQHGDKVEIVEIESSGQFQVCIKKGATLMVPKAHNIGRRVAGMLPSGWNPRTYGISEDVITQVDKVTLYTLVCAVEALLSAGVVDPYEFYQHIHTSDVGICIGSGLGGQSSFAEMFRNRFLDKPVQKDILQETFINTTGAWVNMLLLSSNGPIRTPVGACATALESLDVGYDLISSGKAKMCVVGGADDLQDDVAFEFSNMKATIDPEADFRRGRAPHEMSRPATTSRDGFVEAEGCGLQILTNAKLALDMGLPIYGVVALTQTASDKIGRSVPAPGRGLLAVGSEMRSSMPSPLLDMEYRRQLLAHRIDQIKQEEQLKLALLRKQLSFESPDLSSDMTVEYLRERMTSIQTEAEVQEKEALNTYGNHFYKNDKRISPLRGALAAWGLTVDDIGVASFHGTSTVKGEKNELDVIHRQLDHLGRKKGNPVLGVFQKNLTGHPKGAAGAFMLNGCLQILDSALVPGNANADNIDQQLEQFDHITYPASSIQTDGVKAFSVTSFGFGQKGAQAIGIHARYLFATVGKDRYQQYQKRVHERKIRATAHFQGAIIANKLFVAKDHPPYADDQQDSTLLDPSVRF